MSGRDDRSRSPLDRPSRRPAGHSPLVDAQPPVEIAVDITRGGRLRILITPIIRGHGMDRSREMQFFVPLDQLPWTVVVQSPLSRTDA